MKHSTKLFILAIYSAISFFSCALNGYYSLTISSLQSHQHDFKDRPAAHHLFYKRNNIHRFQVPAYEQLEEASVSQKTYWQELKTKSHKKVKKSFWQKVASFFGDDDFGYEEEDDQAITSFQCSSSGATVDEHLNSFQRFSTTSAAEPSCLENALQHVELMIHEEANERWYERYESLELALKDPFPVYTTYKLDAKAAALLHAAGIDFNNFSLCIGNVAQQHLHSELIEIIHQTADLTGGKKLKPLLDAACPQIVTFADVATQINRSGDLLKGYTVADWCWRALSCVQAAVCGTIDGAAQVAEYALNHPFQTAAWAIAPEFMFACTMLPLSTKVIAFCIDAGSLHLQDLQNPGGRKEEWAALIAPLRALSDVTQQYLDNLSLEQGIHDATQLAAMLLCQQRLCTGLNKLYVRAQKAAVHAMKAGVEAQGVKVALASSNEAIPSKTSQNFLSTGQAINRGARLELVPLAKHPLFDFKGLENSNSHIFSQKHVESGLLNLGTTEEDILQKIMQIIVDVEKHELLQQASNQIETQINGYALAIRTYLKEDKIISINVLMGETIRKVGNLILWPKVK